MDLSFDLADVKPSVMSAIVILVIVTITVPFAKFLIGQGTGKLYIPGLSELVSAI